MQVLCLAMPISISRHIVFIDILHSLSFIRVFAQHPFRLRLQAREQLNLSKEPPALLDSISTACSLPLFFIFALLPSVLQQNQPENMNSSCSLDTVGIQFAQECEHTMPNKEQSISSVSYPCFPEVFPNFLWNRTHTASVSNSYIITLL